MNPKLNKILDYIMEKKDPVSTVNIHWDCRHDITSQSELVKLLRWLHKAGFIEEVDENLWKASTVKQMLKKTKDADDRIMDIIREFQRIKNQNPTSIEIEQWYRTRHGEPGKGLQDFTRHIRDLKEVKKLHSDGKGGYFILGEVSKIRTVMDYTKKSL